MICINGKKKQRFQKLNVNIDENTKQIDSIAFGDNGIKVYSSSKEDVVSSIDVDTYYNRNNGKAKIINRIVNLTFNKQEDDIFSNYHIVCAADTNTKTINDSKVSASAFMIGIKDNIKQLNDEGLIQYSFVLHLIIWDSEDIEKPENYAWAVLISKMKEVETIEKGIPKVLLIVDSDLGNHELFNRRKKPLIDEFYLPENYTISYASADVGSKHPANELIMHCDREANKFMKKYVST